MKDYLLINVCWFIVLVVTVLMFIANGRNLVVRNRQLEATACKYGYGKYEPDVNNSTPVFKWIAPTE